MDIQNDNLVNVLHDLFPLLNQIRFGQGEQSEAIPLYFTLLMAAAKSSPGPCCFVLNKTYGTTAIAAILYALSKLQKDYSVLVEDYSRSALKVGQRVRIKPNDYVFIYEGLTDDNPELFWLGEVGSGNKRTIPTSEILRLEPTSRLNPKGNLASLLGDYEPSSLDRLIDISTSGNNSLLKSTTYILMEQTKFNRLLNSIGLLRECVPSNCSSLGYLPWGSINSNGDLISNDTYMISGEPLISVTRIPEDLATAARKSDVGTKAIFVDGAKGIVSNLQAYDDIVQYQNMIIVASQEETDALLTLKKRGCPIWYLSPEEIMLGECATFNRSRTSFVGAPVCSASVQQDLIVKPVHCNNQNLETAAEHLSVISDQIREFKKDVPEIDRILGQLIYFLYDCSECCFGTDSNFHQRLDEIQDSVSHCSKWISKEVLNEIHGATQAFDAYITSGSSKTEKSDALLKILSKHKGDSQWAIITRTEMSAKHIQFNLDLKDVDTCIEVLSKNKLTNKCEYTGVIIPAWIFERYFLQIKYKGITSNINILVYPFEKERLFEFSKRDYKHKYSNRIDKQLRSTILGIDAVHLDNLDTLYSIPSDKHSTKSIYSVERRVTQPRFRQPATASEGEESRAAQLVKFVGESYALLTEWVSVPCLNDVIDSFESGSLEFKKVSEILIGDLLLFKSSGDKDIMRLVAEEILGSQEYERLRSVASQWKVALLRTGNNPTVVRQSLAKHGLKRKTATISNWLNNPDLIGPGNLEDIEKIIHIAEDKELLSIVLDIIVSIKKIRSTHRSAGRKVTKLILEEIHQQLYHPGDQPMRLSLSYGEVWVVQVEEIESKTMPYPVNRINRLIWD